MSAPYPYRIIKGDDGLSVKVEWDVHYLTDEQIGTVRKYIADIEAENAKLRELVKAAWKCIHSGIGCPDCRTIAGGCTLQTAMRELGVEV